MRIIFFFLIAFSLIACHKDPDNNQPPAAVDTLATGWQKVMIPSLPTTGDIFFINNTTGFVIGGYVIYRSTDGGNSWQKVHQTSTAIVNLAMGSPNNALITTNGSKVFVTTNGGNSFDSVTIADNISDAFFVSATVAYAIGQKCWKTTNGGLNWTSLFDLGASGYRSLHFLNDQTGWCAGNGGVFKTTNGGVNWTQLPTPNFSFSVTGNVYFPDVNNGYISDDNSVGKTTNGGATWTKIYSSQGAYSDLHFLTSTLGYLTDARAIYKTTDGGSTWTREVRVTASNIIVELHFTDANHGWATGGAGYILKYER